MAPKRKICFVITSQIHYARSRTVLRAIREHPGIELQVAVAASALLPQYGDVLSAMAEDGIEADARIIMTLAGGSPVAMAKTTGIGITEFATAFDNLRPDVVVVRGDRYEVLSAAIAASYMNITIAHLEGGDLSGSIDESVRHAITKLAHIHFATNEQSAARIRQLGENPDYIFVTGCPELEALETHTTTITSEELNRAGVGSDLDLDRPFLIVLFHPVTSETGNRTHTEELLQAIHALKMQTVWFWPNADAGTDDVAKAIRVFREKTEFSSIHFLKYLSPDKFIALLKRCTCLVGNSSAGIKETSYLGIPSVNIGSRQDARMRGQNVVDAKQDATSIRKVIETQLAHGRYQRSDVYYREGTGRMITDALANSTLYTQKRFHDTHA